MFDLLDGLQPAEGESENQFLSRLESEAHGGNHVANLHRLRIGETLLAKQPKKGEGRTEWQTKTAAALKIKPRQLRNYLRSAGAVSRARQLALRVPKEALDRPLAQVAGAIKTFKETNSFPTEEDRPRTSRSLLEILTGKVLQIQRGVKRLEPGPRRKFLEATKASIDAMWDDPPSTTADIATSIPATAPVPGDSPSRAPSSATMATRASPRTGDVNAAWLIRERTSQGLEVTVVRGQLLKVLRMVPKNSGMKRWSGSKEVVFRVQKGQLDVAVGGSSCSCICPLKAEGEGFPGYSFATLRDVLVTYLRKLTHPTIGLTHEPGKGLLIKTPDTTELFESSPPEDFKHYERRVSKATATATIQASRLMKAMALCSRFSPTDPAEMDVCELEGGLLRCAAPDAIAAVKLRDVGNAKIRYWGHKISPLLKFLGARASAKIEILEEVEAGWDGPSRRVGKHGTQQRDQVTFFRSADGAVVTAQYPLNSPPGVTESLAKAKVREELVRWQINRVALVKAVEEVVAKGKARGKRSALQVRMAAIDDAKSVEVSIKGDQEHSTVTIEKSKSGVPDPTAGQRTFVLNLDSLTSLLKSCPDEKLWLQFLANPKKTPVLKSTWKDDGDEYTILIPCVA